MSDFLILKNKNKKKFSPSSVCKYFAEKTAALCQVQHRALMWCLVSQIKELCFCCVIMKINQLLTQVALKLDEKILFSHPFGEKNKRLRGYSVLFFKIPQLFFFYSSFNCRGYRCSSNTVDGISAALGSSKTRSGRS